MSIFEFKMKVKNKKLNSNNKTNSGNHSGYYGNYIKDNVEFTTPLSSNSTYPNNKHSEQSDIYNKNVEPIQHSEHIPKLRRYNRTNIDKYKDTIYERYDPMVGGRTALILGSLLVFIVLYILKKQFKHHRRKKKERMAEFVPPEDYGPYETSSDFDQCLKLLPDQNGLSKSSETLTGTNNWDSNHSIDGSLCQCMKDVATAPHKSSAMQTNIPKITISDTTELCTNRKQIGLYINGKQCDKNKQFHASFPYHIKPDKTRRAILEKYTIECDTSNFAKTANWINTIPDPVHIQPNPKHKTKTTTDDAKLNSRSGNYLNVEVNRKRSNSVPSTSYTSSSMWDKTRNVGTCPLCDQAKLTGSSHPSIL
ncbi:unnamed protein product [Owenia fusiformis]|uniref:Uncharacterized protein n=1 Tax=Owenia fusiformis TaxID=6347 RepID=A0A8J1XLF8_OWEFU|nr:unnamed protein product [Owenia fusiformis]